MDSHQPLQKQNPKLDAKEIKKKIEDFLNMVGPSLPVKVAKHLQISSLFASAFLSEMSSEGIVIISNMKVGGSPLYFTPSKYSMLENFINSLGQREKEACLLLKEKSILRDEEQTPVIRVALRSLKDFASPFRYNEDNKIYWKYFLISEIDAVDKLGESKREKETERKRIETVEIEKKAEKEKQEKREKNIEQELIEKQKELEIAKQEIIKLKDKRKQPEQKENLEQKPIISKEIKKPEKQKKAKIKQKPKIKPIDDKFLNEVKEMLEKKGLNIISIEKFDKKEVVGKIKFQNQDYILFAFNKKKIADSDLLKSYKKSLSSNLPYYILSKGDVSKKTKETIEAYKKLASIEKIEEKPRIIEKVEEVKKMERTDNKESTEQETKLPETQTPEQ